MICIIAGSRTATQEQTYEASRLSGWSGEIAETLDGGALGADRWGSEWSRAMRLSIKMFRANWDQHGRAAGPIRNRKMAEHADALIAVWDGKSRGTKNMIEEATNRGLKVFVYRTDAEGGASDG